MTLNVSPTGGSLNAFRKGRSVQPAGFSIVYQTGGLSDTSRTQIAPPSRPLGRRVSRPFACLLTSTPSAAAPVASLPRELALRLCSDAAAAHDAVSARAASLVDVGKCFSEERKPGIVPSQGTCVCFCQNVLHNGHSHSPAALCECASSCCLSLWQFRR